MTPERWREISELFERVADLSPEERQQILVRTDPEVRSEVLSLLACDGATMSAAHAAVEQGAQSVTRAAASAWTGRKLGPWRVTGTLGQGGMGTVLEAVRDDAQYRQRAAIKLVNREMDSEFGRRRFLQERQILAGLDHPAIARLLDGGATEDGLPYLVMEYIEGRDILTDATERDLSIDDRLRLFREVLAGVSYAHQKLVVHRDLKPSNILVTKQGTPKLLDFGIARLLDPDIAGEHALETATSARMMTPDYASPEQVRGEAAAPAADVYSLGAVLYELLTETRAHRLTTYSAAEIVAAVCGTEPRRPSQTAPERWRRKLAGDLDAIVMTALRKDASRRYPSAEAMAEDLRRYLEGRPVRAREDTALYRLGKFARRNLPAVAAGAAAAAALCAGIVTTTIQSRRAERRFQQVRQLANTLLFDIHSELENVPGATAARETIVKTSLAYLNSLAPDALRDPALEWELASAYLRVGDIQDSMAYTNLGKARDALASWAQAARLAEDVARRRREARAYRLVLQARYEMGQAHRGLLELGDSEREVRLGLAAAEEMARLAPGTLQDCGSLASGHNLLGDLAMVTGAPDRALASYDVALQNLRACANDGSRGARTSQIGTHLRRGDALHALGRLGEAEEAYRESLGIGEQFGLRQAVILSDLQLGNVLGAHAAANLGREAEAQERLRAALEAIEAEMREDPRDLHVKQDFAMAASRLAGLLLARDAKQSEKLAARALELVEGPAAENRGDTEWEEKPVMAVAALGAARARLGRPDAEDLLRRAVAEWRALAARNPGEMTWQIAMGLARMELGDWLARRDPARAAAIYREARADLDRARQAAPRHFGVRRTYEMAASRVH
jgi:tRNA A-37 threonylcarbamoyl transferase component Bud32/tetratricopeptide (TPR) repeat protein